MHGPLNISCYELQLRGLETKNSVPNVNICAVGSTFRRVLKTVPKKGDCMCLRFYLSVCPFSQNSWCGRRVGWGGGGVLLLDVFSSNFILEIFTKIPCYQIVPLKPGKTTHFT